MKIKQNMNIMRGMYVAMRDGKVIGTGRLGSPMPDSTTTIVLHPEDYVSVTRSILNAKEAQS